jgi:hypothetical protein
LGKTQQTGKNGHENCTFVYMLWYNELVSKLMIDTSKQRYILTNMEKRAEERPTNEQLQRNADDKQLYQNTKELLTDDAGRIRMAKQLLPRSEAAAEIRSIRNSRRARAAAMPLPDPDPRGTHGFWI